VTTGDSLDATPGDLQRMASLGASVKEMEAAAIASVCEAHGVPVILLKAVTDLVDVELEAEGNSTQEQFLKNYTHSIERLTDALEHLLRKSL
jgi:nucleoside phosphorylase